MEELIIKSKAFYNDNKKLAITFILIIVIILLCGGCTLTGIIANYLFFKRRVIEPTNEVIVKEEVVEVELKEKEDIDTVEKVNYTKCTDYNLINVEYFDEPKLKRIKLFDSLKIGDETYEIDDYVQFYTTGRVEKTGIRNTDLKNYLLIEPVLKNKNNKDRSIEDFFSNQTVILYDESQDKIHYFNHSLKTNTIIDYTLNSKVILHPSMLCIVERNNFLEKFESPLWTCNSGKCFHLEKPSTSDKGEHFGIFRSAIDLKIIDELILVDNVDRDEIYKADKDSLKFYVLGPNNLYYEAWYYAIIEQGDETPIKWKDGSTEKVYAYTDSGSCTNEMSLTSRRDLDETDLIVTGHLTDTKENIYELKDRNDNTLKEFYEEYVKGYEGISDILTYEEYLELHPIFYYKSPYGEYIEYKNAKLIPDYGGCPELYED